MGLTFLHLGDEFLVEHASCLLVKWAIDGNNVTSVLEVSRIPLEVLEVLVSTIGSSR